MRKRFPVIVIFCYNRIYHLKKTFFALKKNFNFNKFKVLVFIDGPKNESDVKKIKKINKFLKKIKNQKIKIFNHRINLGLKTNIIQGLNQTFKKFQKAIILEDDIYVNKNFLNYMHESLNFYEFSPNVASISAYTPIKKKYMQNYKFDLYFSKRHFSWGWATWADRWNKFIFDEKKIKKNLKPKDLKNFGNIGNDLPILLKLTLENKLSSWSILFDFNCFKKKLICVCPKFSMVKNLGFEGSGTHIHQDFLNNQIEKEWRPKFFLEPYFDDRLMKLEKISIEGEILQKIKNKILKFIKIVCYLNRS